MHETHNQRLSKTERFTYRKPRRISQRFFLEEKATFSPSVSDRHVHTPPTITIVFAYSQPSSSSIIAQTYADKRNQSAIVRPAANERSTQKNLVPVKTKRFIVDTHNPDEFLSAKVLFFRIGFVFHLG